MCQIIITFFFVKQKTSYDMRISDWSSDICSSDLVFGLQALLAIDDLEAHFLPFLQAFETRTGDGAEMHEHVRAILAADKAETLGVVEPLDRSEERGVGKKGDRTCRSRWQPYN